MSDKSDKGIEVLTSLTEDEWLDLYNRLRGFIAGRYHGPLRDDDLISKAFECVKEGSRQHWNVDQSPFRNMCQIITSLASNELVKLKREVSLDVLNSYEPGPSTSISQSPARMFEAREMDQIFISRIEKVVEDDAILQRILPYLFADPPFKPAEIAAAVHVHPSEIYKARKRLRRKVALSRNSTPGDKGL